MKSSGSLFKYDSFGRQRRLVLYSLRIDISLKKLDTIMIIANVEKEVGISYIFVINYFHLLSENSLSMVLMHPFPDLLS